jgi:hypothetical protein
MAPHEWDASEALRFGDGTQYVTGKVPAGAYLVRFQPVDDNRHVAEYWDDSRTSGGARLVTVEPSTTTSGVNAVLHLRGVATAFVPLVEQRNVEMARVGFAQTNPLDRCWFTTLEVRIVEASTLVPNRGRVVQRYAVADFTARNDCYGTFASSTTTVDLVGVDASVDPFTGAHVTGLTIPVDGGAFFGAFDLDLEWVVDGKASSVRGVRTATATIGGTAISNPSTVVRFTPADVVVCDMVTFAEAIIR